MTAAWTREAIEALGPTTNVPTTAAIVDVDPETVYGMIRRGEWTMTRVLRLGRKIKIPTLDLVRLLYAPETDAAPVSYTTPAVPSQCQHLASGQVTSSVPHSQCGCTTRESAVIRPLRGA